MGSLLAIPAAATAVVTGLANEGLLYWLYYVISYAYLYIDKLFRGRRLDVYNFKVDGQPEKTGLFIPKEEYALDYPQQKVKLRKSFDDTFFYGINSSSESLSIHISRKPHGYVCSSLLIRLSDGKLYTLPEEHKIQKEIDGEPGAFGSARFKAQCLLPFRKWRIFFNGILREVSEEEKEVAPNFKHIAFTFLWTASSEVFDYNDDIPTKVLAHAAASSSLFPVLNLQRMRDVLNGYEQPGMILGTLKSDGEEKEIYLWGVRGRYRGSRKVVPDSSILQIYGTFKTGAIVHLESRYIPGVSQKFTFGYVMKSDGFIHPIFADREKISENLMRFSFGCDDENYLLDIRRKSLFKKEFEKEFGSNTEVQQNLMELNGVDGRGLVFSGKVKESVMELQHLKTKAASSVIKCGHSRESTPLSVPFKDPCCQISDLTGGKGSSLGKLYVLSKDASFTRSRFEVPLGVVVTTKAYEEFIKGDLIQAMNEFEKSVWSHKDADVSTLCKALSDKVSKTSIPEKIIASVINDLELTFGPNWTEMKFAVRSSATGEDTSQMSAAGQMETYLGLKGKEQIFDAVRKCWASQFFIHPIQYKRRYGQLLNMPMAVVIQQMVACDVAGVLFTCDPVTGNPEFLSISANYGLGESVVSASADPDTVVVRRDVNNRLSYHSAVIGQKKSKIIMDDDLGTKEIAFDTPATDCCLKKDAALKLAEIAVQIEEEFGNPRDIEWGIAKNRVFLFQSRPVTSVDTDTEFEAMHFYDSHLRTEEEYCTTANVAEVLPGCTVPLSADWMQRYMLTTSNRQIGIGWNKNTGPNLPYFHKMVCYRFTHCFIPLIDGFMGFDDDGLLGKAMMVSIFGRIIDERQTITKMAVDRHGKTKPPSFFRKIMDSLYFLMIMFGATQWNKAGAKDAKIKKIHYKDKKTSESLMKEICGSVGKFWMQMFCHFLATSSSSYWNMMLLTLLAKAKGTLDNEVYSDFAYLLSTCTQLESADIPAAIQNLACVIAKCIDPEKFKAMDVEEAVKWLQNTDTDAGVKFRKFLERHGCRCGKEFDFYSKPWIWDQQPLVKSLQASMSGNIESAEEKKTASFSEVLSNLHVKLDFFSRLKLRLLLPNARRGVRERETSKALSIRVVHEARKPFHRLADMLVEEGRLPQKDLMFFLSVEEIRQLIKTRSPRIVARAQKRFSYHSEMEKLLFPEIMCGIPRPTNIYKDYDEAVEGTMMTGFPVSQGVVKAPACVVPTLADAHIIKPGDVLITYSTDIGWSPYFPLLSGIVTELGGLVSHGAVVAREYGLPCVVGLQGATKVFKSGDIVVLDGTKGTIKKIK